MEISVQAMLRAERLYEVRRKGSNEGRFQCGGFTSRGQKNYAESYRRRGLVKSG